jgi:lysophospholipase L1-like esterase
MLRQAISLQPKVMSVWIGNNDILGGVTSGTIEVGVTVTPVSVYSALMDKALDTLLRETDAHLFLANIPSITSIPFVTALPRSPFDPASFQAIDTSARLLTEEPDVRYVLLPALAALLQGTGLPEPLGSGDSLPGDLTLTDQEVEEAEALVDGYNAYLEGKATANPDRITIVDVHALLDRVTSGLIPGLSGKFPLVDSAESVFSFDGIHPNAKGYREVANLFLETMNTALGEDFPLVE